MNIFVHLRAAHQEIVLFPAGQEYEVILAERLRCAGIAFFSEGRLREEGFFKTPDVKLEVIQRFLGHALKLLYSSQREN